MKKTILVSLLTIASSAYLCNAQNPNTPPPSVSDTRVDNKPPSSEEIRSGNEIRNSPPPSAPAGGRYLTSREFIITTMVALMGLIALAMEFFILRTLSRLKAEDILRVFAVTLILVGTLFFITAGFDSNQIAPAMGLFGTVAGYLLGRSIDRKEKDGE